MTATKTSSFVHPDKNVKEEIKDITKTNLASTVGLA